MTQNSAVVSLAGSRLVQILSGLASPDAGASAGRFSERLGQLIDLADSIKIAEAQGNRPARAFQPGMTSGPQICAEYRQVRSSMVRTIERSFDPRTGPSRVKLPAPDNFEPGDLVASCEPYLNFYRAHQRDISFRAQNLQALVRESAGGISPELARLTALDTALGNTLAVHTRQFFAGIPGLLASHFRDLLREDPDLLWELQLEKFCAAMRALLLAEIEARLLPVTGLIEAIEENSD